MKEKLAKATYMCVGALIAFAAYLLGNVNNSINAQPEVNLPVLDEIVVRKLRVVNAEGNTVIALDQDVNGGSVVIHGKDSKSQASLRITTDGGGVALIDKDGKLGVVLDIDVNGGNLGVLGKDDKCGVLLHIAADGGSVSVDGKDGKSQASLGINANGGTVKVDGKDGNQAQLTEGVS